MILTVLSAETIHLTKPTVDILMKKSGFILRKRRDKLEISKVETLYTTSIIVAI